MRLLTLNAHAWREENSDKKIIYLAKTIIERDYDIIALQEVNQMLDCPLMEGRHLRSNNYMVVLLQEIERQGGPKYHSYWQSAKTLREYYEEGLCILSKTPILEERVFTISRNAEHTSPKKRNIVSITTKYNDKLVDIYSCHLGWWRDEVEPFKPQWDALYKQLRADRLSFLLGDFNNNANLREEGYDYILSHKLWDTYALAREKDGGATVQGEIVGWEGNKVDLRIDLILASEKVEVVSSKVIFNGKHKQMISDHYGVEVKVRL